MTHPVGGGSWAKPPEAETLSSWTFGGSCKFACFLNLILIVKRQKPQILCVVLQRWRLISHALACVWFTRGLFISPLPSKFLLEGSRRGARAHGAAVLLWRRPWLSAASQTRGTFRTFASKISFNCEKCEAQKICKHHEAVRVTYTFARALLLSQVAVALSQYFTRVIISRAEIKYLKHDRHATCLQNQMICNLTRSQFVAREDRQ